MCRPRQRGCYDAGGVADDLQRLDAWAKGDAAAGRELVELHFDSLARFFRGKVADGIDDLIQGAFLACLEQYRQGREIANFRNYLFIVARNALYARLRAEGREGPPLDPAAMTLADVATSPTGRIARSEDHQSLLDALRHIPLDLQLALELHYWEKLSMADIGEVLGVPAGTVKSRLHRARDLVRARLEAIGEGEVSLEETMSRLDDWARAIRESR